MNLAYRLRPQSLAEFFGQGHLVGKDKIIQKMIETQTVSSMIFWGPPGSGKTTLAYLIAKASNANFHHLSAVKQAKLICKKLLNRQKKNRKIRAKQSYLLTKYIGGTKRNS